MEEEAKKEGCEPQERDICFIITPIGEEGSAIRKKTDGLIDNVLKPVCNEFGMKAVPAHYIDKIGSITNQVVQHVLESKMVIANLTGLNPNVMYELAIRHASKKPVVCIAENGTNLPFDITTERTIFYSDDMYGATRLKYDLQNKLQNALKDGDIDNPIYRAIKDSSIIKEIQSLPQNEKSDSLLYILQRLDNIESAIKRNTDIKSKEIITPYKGNENHDSLINVFTIILSKPFTKKMELNLKNYLDNYIKMELIINYEISGMKIVVTTNANWDVSFIKNFELLLKEKYDIEIKSLSVNTVPL